MDNQQIIEMIAMLVHHHHNVHSIMLHKYQDPISLALCEIQTSILMCGLDILGAVIKLIILTFDKF